MTDARPAKRTLAPSDAQVRTAWSPGLPVLDEVLSELTTSLDVLGGRLYDVGAQDGLLADLARNRRIRYRLRYPRDFDGPAAIVLISPGGLGGEDTHTWYPHLGTAYARLGFLAVSLGHLPSVSEMQHRYNLPLDASFVIDALARTAASARGTPWDAEEALSLPPEFQGEPDVDHIGVLGHSFGAYTAHALAGAELGPAMGIHNFRDPRVDAIVVIAPQGRDRYGFFDKGPDNNSWRNVTVPSYVLLGEHDLPDWRRRPFDRYPAIGDKFLTIGKDQNHAEISGSSAPIEVRHLLALNTALFFHTYLRGGDGRCKIGTLAWIDGWTLDRKLDEDRLPCP